MPKGKDLYNYRRDNKQLLVIKNNKEGIGDYYKIKLLFN